ncbi:MAG TPA: ABC transporter ATP-binding protein [Pirellulales bacterium]|jgi:putative ABC transport system ATP-binding protein|nr:ABC transporter ATP-binding protein [Pirellulales bacterium]
MDSRHRAVSPPLLHLDRVGKTYVMGEVAVEVLRNVSIEIETAEILAIVGPSGSGKSTLLNLIGGLDKPTSGAVWYREQDLSRLSARELTLYRRDTVGFVFQFYNLVPNLTARENVLVSTEISRHPLDVDESLELVGLTDRADHFPSQMSGGEQQRVAIARALAKNPELLLCDEPTGALDFETGKRVLRLLVEVREKLNKTVLIITHNSAIAQIADRVIRLRSGEVVETTENRQPVAPEEVIW